MRRARTLRRRIVVAMVGFGAAVCLVYSALSFLFVYAVEDAFFETLLANEAEYVARELAAGRTGRPRLPFVRLYGAWSSVPAEVRGLTIRERGEVAGADGRHYHVRRVPVAGRGSWLVAEVSPLLVVRPMRGRLLTILLPATALVLLGASIVAALVARRSVRQLTALVDAVERGDVFPRSSDHEVRVLAEGLEAALDRVHAMLQREKAFAGDVSHELRTPLAVIRGAAELLERRDLDVTARAQVGRIREAARSSEEIIDLLLALAREESAHEAPAPVPLLALVEKVVLRQTELLARPDVEVQVEIAPQLRVTAPPAAAEIVIANLIANALRHGRGGTVAITSRDRSLSIRNSGAAVVTGGRGIGLNLVRRLCVACGFTLTFDSSEAETTATIAF